MLPEPEGFEINSICKGSVALPEPEGSGILSGLIPFKIQIASMTSLTPAGGCFIVFITVMSCRETTLNYQKSDQTPFLTETAATTTNSISTEVKGAAVASYRWRECIERSKGSLQDRNSFTQVLIAFIFYCLSCCSLLVCDCLVCFHHLYNINTNSGTTTPETIHRPTVE